MLINHFILLVVFNLLHGNIDQEIDLANSHGLQSLTFFITISRAMRYFDTRVREQLEKGKYAALSEQIKHS